MSEEIVKSKEKPKTTLADSGQDGRLYGFTNTFDPPYCDDEKCCDMCSPTSSLPAWKRFIKRALKI